MKIKNISELSKISLDTEIKEKKAINKKGKEFLYKYITFDGQDYWLPSSVLKSLKTILEKDKDLKYFRVKKTEQGEEVEKVI
jgi:hypothetical protein